MVVDCVSVAARSRLTRSGATTAAVGGATVVVVAVDGVLATVVDGVAKICESVA